MCGRHHWWGGSLKTVEGSAGGLASVLLSTLLLYRAGLFTIPSWTSMPSLNASYYQVRCVDGTTGGVGPWRRWRGVPETWPLSSSPPFFCSEPTSSQSFLDLHAFTKASYYQVRCVDDTTGGAAPWRQWRGVPQAWPLSSSPTFFCPELASSLSARGPPCHH